MWTLVCINGEWLHVDATFDDQTPISHEYFLVGSDYMCGDHTFSDSLESPIELKFDEKKVEKETKNPVKKPKTKTPPVEKPKAPEPVFVEVRFRSDADR